MNLASYKAGNNFKTFVFVAALTALLIGIGYLIGGATGLIVFAAIAVVFNFVMYWFSGSLALKMARAVEVSPQQEPELHQMIARLAERAGVPKPASTSRRPSSPTRSPPAATPSTRPSP